MMHAHAMGPSDDPERADWWRAVVQNDAAWDGVFFYGVQTTGIFCRPSCGARTPRRENVRFFETADAARAAGLRACKRCRPDEHDRVDLAVAEACRALASAAPPRLGELARGAGVSPSQFRRRFRARVGVTPKQYELRFRADRAATVLASSPTVTAAVYEAGYSTPSRFYEGASPRHGMRASKLRRGGEGEVLRFTVRESALGPCLIAATRLGVCAVLLEREPDASAGGRGLPEQLRARFPRATLEQAGSDSDFERWVEQALLGLGGAPSASLPLDVRATAFQEQVWRALRGIPVGETTTYSDLATQLGRPRGARAVARAVAANPVAVIIPCHRVIGRDGSPRGYRWGIDLKRKLIAREVDE